MNDLKFLTFVFLISLAILLIVCWCDGCGPMSISSFGLTPKQTQTQMMRIKMACGGGIRDRALLITLFHFALVVKIKYRISCTTLTNKWLPINRLNETYFVKCRIKTEKNCTLPLFLHSLIV